ncbi:MAG: hypothetical protein AAFY99_13725, partial [Pseudomonadota bacterium]
AVRNVQLVAMRANGASLSRSIKLNGPPLRAFISSNNRYALLPSTQNPVVDVIDLNTLQRVKTLETPSLITQIQTDPLSQAVIGVAPDTDSIVIFDMAELTVRDAFRMRVGAELLALNEESGLAYVHGGQNDRRLQIVNVRGQNEQKTIRSFELDQPLWAMTSTNALAVCH